LRSLSSRPLAEIRGVICPYGIIAAYVWDYANGARLLREFWDAALEVDPEAPAFDQARTLCTQDGLRMLFTTANLEEIRLQALKVITRFANFNDYWEPFCGGQGSAPNYLATRDDRTRFAIRERLRASLPTDAQGAIVLPARAWPICGRRPQP
jgi:hypothetical protein